MKRLLFSTHNGLEFSAQESVEMAIVLYNLAYGVVSQQDRTMAKALFLRMATAYPEYADWPQSTPSQKFRPDLRPRPFQRKKRK